MNSNIRFIFVIGGVVSSLGKGIASASIGLLLKSCGYKVNLLKADPYINVDPGTMNPYQHGEVFVTDDGVETDLDLGHYERFLNQKMNTINNFTSGQVYDTVIKNERKGKYLGETVQVIPHITDEIKKRIFKAAEGYEILIVEIGGTVGDIESLPFLEAIRQFRFEIEPERHIFIHMTLIPWISSANELKTKPTQHSVNKLREIGIQPDIILCRSGQVLSEEIKAKIALFTNVKKEDVITGLDVDCVYKIPIKFKQENLHSSIFKKLSLENEIPHLGKWEEVVQRYQNPKDKVKIVIAGKYTKVRDSYKSLFESLEHAATEHHLRLDLETMDVEKYEQEQEILSEYDGILVPGGFGERAIEEKISFIKLARENSIPFLGLCLGFQLALIEFARNVVLLKNATSKEFSTNPGEEVVKIMEKQKNELNLGGTMRLGTYRADFRSGTKIASIYKAEFAEERHRHRFEMNNDYLEQFEKKGMIACGFYRSKLVEAVELQNHPWFIAVQYHPEFLSSPLKPHPLFLDFIRASYQNRQNRKKN